MQRDYYADSLSVAIQFVVCRHSESTQCSSLSESIEYSSNVYSPLPLLQHNPAVGLALVSDWTRTHSSKKNHNWVIMILWFYGSLWTDLINEWMNEWIINPLRYNLYANRNTALSSVLLQRLSRSLKLCVLPHSLPLGLCAVCCVPTCVLFTGSNPTVCPALCTVTLCTVTLPAPRILEYPSD